MKKSILLILSISVLFLILPNINFINAQTQATESYIMKATNFYYRDNVGNKVSFVYRKEGDWFDVMGGDLPRVINSSFKEGDTFTLGNLTFIVGSVDRANRKVEISVERFGILTKASTIIFNGNVDVNERFFIASYYPEYEIEPDCNGCLKDSKCYPFGYRKSEKYCSDNYEFIDYKESKEFCENNFECGGNLCISKECVSENSLKRFLKWFKRKFRR